MITIHTGKTVVLIPSLEPDMKLPEYIYQLRDYGLKHIIVVNDGSGEQYHPVFQRLEELGCTVLCHSENRGKGEALKTGFLYIERHVPDTACIVTADSDGQHAAEDVFRLAEEARRHPDALLLGTRDFSKGGIPPKSLLGNRVTSVLFGLLYGTRLPDTQTGLRAFGPQLLEYMTRIKGSRFEYELQMLIFCLQSGIQILPLPIQVIYENGNAGTHFHAVRDSMQVMRVLLSSFLRFISSSVSSAVVDLGAAWLLMDLLQPLLAEQNYLRILLATVIARALSIVVNYSLNKRFVFRWGETKRSLWRYLALCGLIIVLSSGGVYLLHELLSLSEKIAKVICDGLLFLLSYQVQRRWVFAATRRKQHARSTNA